MAELIISDEEREAKTYLEWSDETLGKLVKKLAHNILKDKDGHDSAMFTSALTYVVCDIARQGHSGVEVTLKGVTDGDKECGIWQINIDRLDVENMPPKDQLN